MAALLVFVLATWLALCSAECDQDDVAVYRMTLKTFWTEERFPKYYPQYNPQAQWAAVFGQSHNRSHHLFELGELGSPELREYCQSGSVSGLAASADDDQRVYDQFAASAIPTGEGSTENVFFVGGQHSLVSLVSRLVPSPDWFVGVDSLQLCVDSEWVDEVSLSLDPLDAGAADGLSFTSPHWPTVPPARVSRHTAQRPAHEAAAFHYPRLRHLPAIATVHFVKIKEYSNKDLNDLVHKEVRKELNMAKEKLKSVTIEPVFEEITTKNSLDTLKDLEEDPVGTPKPNLPSNRVIVVTEGPKSRLPEGADLGSADDLVLAVARGELRVPGRHLPRHFKHRLHQAINRITEEDCLVSEWGDWSPCSVSCGAGYRERVRRVLRSPTPPRGRKCPPLTDRQHCGVAGTCFRLNHFRW